MPDRQTPWYMRLVVGLGAWITAVVAMLLGGAIEAKLDSELAATAMGYRELRCPKPLS